MGFFFCGVVGWVVWGDEAASTESEYEENHEKPHDITVLWALLHSKSEIANAQQDCYQIDDDI
jgi:hypothetical protein